MRAAAALPHADHGPRRHARCPGCGRLFRVTGGAVPESGVVLGCPACGAPVALMPPPDRRRTYLIVDRPPRAPAAPDAGGTTVSAGGFPDPVGPAATAPRGDLGGETTTARAGAGARDLPTDDGAAPPTDVPVPPTDAIHDPGARPAPPVEATPLRTTVGELSLAGGLSAGPAGRDVASSRRSRRRGRRAAVGALSGAALLAALGATAVGAPSAALDGPAWPLTLAAAGALVGAAAAGLLGSRR